MKQSGGMAVPPGNHADFTGQTGITLCALKCIGRVKVGDAVISAISRKNFLLKGQQVKIVGKMLTHWEVEPC